MGPNSTGDDEERQQFLSAQEEEQRFLPDRNEGPPPEDDGLKEFEKAGSAVSSVLWPVVITMSLVVLVVGSLEHANIVTQNYWQAYMVYNESAEDSPAEKLGGAFLNAVIFIVVILVTTVAFFLLYKFRCMKILYGWIMFSTTTLLGVLGGFLFYLMLMAYSVTMDWITFSILVWNFSVVGMVAIFWKAPTIVTQGYLVCVSVVLAWTFTKMPDWTLWMLLIALVVYDIGVVLTPKGPLKMLVELAQQRNEPIPGLIYDARPSTLHYEGPQTDHWNAYSRQPTDSTATSSNNSAPEVRINASERPQNAGASGQQLQPHPPGPRQNGEQQQQQPQGDEDDEDEKHIKLGLGDFVFYSVLIARAAEFDFTTVATCFFSILTGLCSTLVLLGIFRRALPALPISITLGIVYYFLTRSILFPFVVLMATNQVYL